MQVLIEKNIREVSYLFFTLNPKVSENATFLLLSKMPQL